MNVFKVLILFFLILVFQKVQSQTLIMNEVSNGPAGNQEYVEFVVVSNVVTYTCNSPTPPCIDIRGWIFDDNSGYHGGSGVAPGAVRFANNPIWACVPLGTIILIYNDGDRNIAIPPDDLSMVDGNCTIIAPMNSNLFESNATTPGAVACSYPAVGWTLGGNWNNTVFANGGDCARIVNLAGCEVFSVCWGSDNLNNLIYFPATAAQRVYYFNDINPQLQANWTNGSASPSPGSQTPGAPNNALNAAYIAQFNNGCLPITSISVTATSVNAGCTCTGSATANASGSIPGYTYLWSNGQTSATATGLCAGIYTVTATSHIGCSISTTVNITSSSSVSVTVNSQTICAGGSTILTASPSTLGGTYIWSPGGQTTQTISISPGATTTYSISYLLSGCSTSTTASVLVNPLPIVTVNSSTICAGQSASLTSAGATSYTWNTGSTLNPLTVSPLVTTNFTVTGASAAGCTNTAVASVLVNPLPIVTVNSSTICVGQSATLTSAGATTYTWNTGSTLNPLTVSPLTTTNFTVTGTTAGCTNTAVASVLANPLPIVTVNSSTICVGQSATLTSSGATTYTWNTGSTLNPLTVSPLVTTNFTVIGMTAGCTNTAIATVSVNPLPIVTVNSSTICEGQSATLTSAGATTYTWNTGSTLNPLTVSPLVTTNFTVTGTTAGCTNTAVAAVSVNPLPIVAVNSSTICEGQSTTLTSTGATTYTWNTGSTLNPLTVSPLTTTNFTVTGASAAGCTNTAVASVLVNPLPIVTVNSSTICVGQSATLTSAGATTYTWNTGSTLNPLTVSPLITTNFTVTGTAAGCTNTAVATVFISPNLTLIVNNPTICIGQTVTLTVAGASTYTWSNGTYGTSLLISPISNSSFTINGVSGVCSGSTIATVSVNPLPIVTVNSSTICVGQSTTLTSAGATTYTWNTGSTLNPLTVSPLSTTNYTVTGATAGCTNTAVASVSVNPLPIVTVNSSTICEGQSATLISAGATTYTWNTGSTINTLTVSPLVTTNYTVTGTTAGCTNTAVATVSVNPLPIVTVNSSTICEGQSATLTSAGATTFVWNTGSTVNPLTVSPLVTTNYTVTGTTAGCTNTAVATVSVNPLPIVTVNSSTICAGQSATLTSAGATTYNWNTGSTLNPLTVSPLTTTNYTVTGTTAGCTNKAIASVLVNPLPIISASASPPVVCRGIVSNLSAFGASNYTWSPSGALSNTIPVSPAITSIYTVTGTNGSGTLMCSSTQTVLLTIIPQPTVIAFSSASICIGESKNIYAEGADSYSWLPTIGVSNPTAFSTFVKPSTTTIYTVTASNGGLCSGTATVQIVVNPLPFVYAGADTTINMDESYVLHGTGNVTVGFLSPNGIPLICNYCPVVEVNPIQTTCYTLKGENEFGCVAYDEVCINITKDWNVYIPNAFSPNGDSDNDVFIPVGYGLSEIKLYIFDRWGAQIFKSHDDVVGWNGEHNGNPCEQNVYVYKAEIKTMTGLKFFRTGHVTLLSELK